MYDPEDINSLTLSLIYDMELVSECQFCVIVKINRAIKPVLVYIYIMNC